ncbi:MAG: DUF4296 domain-containing protein [Bacteroidales bacterium]|nr:DUF4296 domain-containing protein [Bacteroidales bacterium]
MKRISKIAKHLVLLLAIFLLTACQTWRPFNVIKPSVMEDLLYDIHMTEGTIATLYPNMRREDQRASYDALFEKYHVTRSQFEKSLAWYSAHPDEFGKIYDNLDVRFTQLVDDVKNYRFHDEMSHLLALDTLSKVNIYAFPKHQRIEHTPSDSIVSFCVDQSLLFAPTDKYVWRFYYQAMPIDTASFDSLPSTVMYLKVYYNNGTSDSVAHKINAKGHRKKYMFSIKCPETLTPVKIEGSFYAGGDILRWLQVDSATLMRYYNARVYPLSKESMSILDSIAVASNLKVLPSIMNHQTANSMEENTLKIANVGGRKTDVRLPQKNAVREESTPVKHADNRNE